MLQMRIIRVMKGWSIREVADRTGINKSNLSLIERGMFPIYPGWRKRLAEVFQVPESVLFEKVNSEEIIDAMEATV